VTATQDLATIDAALLKIVRAKAAGLIGTYGFSPSDGDDIRQELVLDCIIRFRKFDPAKSSCRSFVSRIVNNRVATLVEGQRARCRDYRACRSSLNDQIEFAPGESMELAERVSADEYEARIGRSVLSARDRVELQIDVARVIATLPQELAAIANLLRSVGVGETSHQLGVPRSTLYRRIADIRELFESAGLHLYLNCLETAPSKRPSAWCDVPTVC
jgi:DNA-directed RNA polymerase specialized sigma24 family protein